MPRTNSKNSKQSKSTNGLAKRVKKLETLTKNVIDRSWWYNDFVSTTGINSGVVIQDPFSLGLIAVADPASLTPSQTAYGIRIGPKITITRMNMKMRLKFADVLGANRYQRLRVIIFKIPPTFTSGAGVAQPFPLPSDILELTVGVGNVGKTSAYYKKNSKLTYTIIKDQTYMLGCPTGVVNSAPSVSALAQIYPSTRFINMNFNFPKGLDITYDSNGNVKHNQYRLLLISENDVDSPDFPSNQCPDVHVMTRTNYIQ
jgi:hypothetical protein